MDSLRKTNTKKKIQLHTFGQFENDFIIRIFSNIYILVVVLEKRIGYETFNSFNF